MVTLKVCIAITKLGKCKSAFSTTSSIYDAFTLKPGKSDYLK